MDPDFLAALGPAPTFVPCPRCGRETASPKGVPCWDCQRADEAKRDAEHAERRLGIPPRFGWARFGGSELAERVRILGRSGPVDLDVARRHILSWAGPAVLFLGAAGTGKTSFAIACLRETAGPCCVSASALERARIEHRAGDGEAPLVKRALSARVLLIDDLGQDKASNVSAVEAVVLARHDANLTTWVTTGLTPEELESRYGAGVRRRLTEPGVGLVVRFGSPQARTEDPRQGTLSQVTVQSPKAS